MASRPCRFSVPIFPRREDFAAGIARIRLRVYCYWFRDPTSLPNGTDPWRLDSAFLAPDLPFSFFPRRFIDKLGIRLSPIPGADLTEVGRPWGLGRCAMRVGTLQFPRHQMRPRRRKRCRTFHVIGLLGELSPILASPECTPLLGADFLAENRMRIRADYDLLGPRPTAQSIELNPTDTPWGSLLYPG
jgi:hypothetical protein